MPHNDCYTQCVHGKVMLTHGKGKGMAGRAAKALGDVLPPTWKGRAGDESQEVVSRLLFIGTGHRTSLPPFLLPLLTGQGVGGRLRKVCRCVEERHGICACARRQKGQREKGRRRLFLPH